MTNKYCTLTDYKNYATARGQSTSTDTTDDGVITNLITQASRFIDRETKRQFYPTIETHLFNCPDTNETIILDGDLLALTTLTNGDSVVIASTDYLLRGDGNRPPYWGVGLRDISTVSWTTGTDGSADFVISLLGIWGYHDQYSQRAWLQVGTLGAAITDTSTLAFTASGGHTIAVGNILKIDSEYFNINTVATNTITPVKRGDNGSTAATHLISAPIYAWQPMDEVKQYTLEIAHSAYLRRFGKNTGESAIVTAAGVVLSPQDITAQARAFINNMRRIVWR